MRPMDTDDTDRIEEIRQVLEDADVDVESIDVDLNGPIMKLNIRGHTHR